MPPKKGSASRPQSRQVLSKLLDAEESQPSTSSGTGDAQPSGSGLPVRRSGRIRKSAPKSFPQATVAGGDYLSAQREKEWRRLLNLPKTTKSKKGSAAKRGSGRPSTTGSVKKLRDRPRKNVASQVALGAQASKAPAAKRGSSRSSNNGKCGPGRLSGSSKKRGVDRPPAGGRKPDPGRSAGKGKKRGPDRPPKALAALLSVGDKAFDSDDDEFVDYDYLPDQEELTTSSETETEVTTDEEVETDVVTDTDEEAETETEGETESELDIIEIDSDDEEVNAQKGNHVEPNTDIDSATGFEAYLGRNGQLDIYNDEDLFTDDSDDEFDHQELNNVEHADHDVAEDAPAQTPTNFCIII